MSYRTCQTDSRTAPDFLMMEFEDRSVKYQATFQQLPSLKVALP